MAKGTIYISGPMRGYAQFNFPAFHAAEKELTDQGWNVLSPARVDLENGFDPNTPEVSLTPAMMREFIHRDVDMIVDNCDAVAVLPGWEKSKGATAEVAIAKWKGIPVYRYPAMVELDQEDVLDEASRITRGDRQASYGPPDQDFQRTAKMWSAMFGHLLKDDAVFGSEHVAQAMIALKPSRLQHSKKKDSVTDIAGYARCMDLCYRVTNYR